MKEIGGYIEFERYSGQMYYADGINLNLGRNALAYLIEARNIKKMLMPEFMCDSCDYVLEKYKVKVRKYNIDYNFQPVDISLEQDEWLYIVNYYGQLSDDYIGYIKEKYIRIIADYTQAFFQRSIIGIDTIYSCRKYFGVTDGAILITDCRINRELEQDISYDRMIYKLGRFEKNGQEFYEQYKQLELKFNEYPLMKMSKLTRNLLNSIEYDKIKKMRKINFLFLNEKLKSINKLKLTVPNGAFMYPLYIDNGAMVRRMLQKIGIYSPCLWPNVFDNCSDKSLEWKFSKNIVALPIDQRYNLDDMDYMIKELKKII